MNAPHPEIHQIDDSDHLPLPWDDEDEVVARLAAQNLHQGLHAQGDWPLIRTDAPIGCKRYNSPPAFWAMESLLQAPCQTSRKAWP